jgi:hypothetical protein
VNTPSAVTFQIRPPVVPSYAPKDRLDDPTYTVPSKPMAGVDAMEPPTGTHHCTTPLRAETEYRELLVPLVPKCKRPVELTAMEPVTGPPASYLHLNVVSGPLGTTPAPTPECRESRPNCPQGWEKGERVGVIVGVMDGVAEYVDETDAVTLEVNVGENVGDTDAVSVTLGDIETDNVAEYDGVVLGVDESVADDVPVAVTEDDGVAENVDERVAENVGLTVGVSEDVAELVAVGDGEELGLATAYNTLLAPINTAPSAVITGEFAKSVPKWMDHETTPNGALSMTNVPLDSPTYSRPALSKAAAVLISASKYTDHATAPLSAFSAYTNPSPEPTMTYPNVGEMQGMDSTLYPVECDHAYTPVAPLTAYTKKSADPKYTRLLNTVGEYTAPSTEYIHASVPSEV